MKTLLVISVVVNLFLFLFVGLLAGALSELRKLYEPSKKAPLKKGP